MSFGYRIILTADRTLMSEYSGGIFLGFSACIPRGLVPDSFYFTFLCPSVEVNRDGSVIVAPYGVRKIEAALLDYGFKRNEIIVVHPDYLERVIGSETRVLGISVFDPLGIGPATTTFTGIFGGEAYMAIKFRELLSNPIIRRRKIKVIVGGPGAWQLENDDVRRDLGIDTVVVGEGEKVVGPLFEKAVRGEDIPSLVYGDVVDVNEIPVIKGGAIHGIVEIARGCGRGCTFCIPTLQSFRCLPINHILKEVEVNIKVGRQPLLHAEDILRYKAKGIELNKQAVIELFKNVKNHPKVENVEISHFSLSSVVSAPDLIEELSSILNLNSKNWLGGQTGIETGSPRIMDIHMKGKCKPFSPNDWPEIIVKAFEILNENHWVPCGTIIIGLPGEEEKDIELTISLVEQLKPFKSLIIPLFFVSTGTLKWERKSFTLNNLTPKHTELIFKCWKHNFTWLNILTYEWIEMSIKNKITKTILKKTISYGIQQTLKYMKICEKDYNYDLKTMIEDFKNGKLKIKEPIPIKILKTIIK